MISSHDVTVAGYLILAAALLGLEVIGRRGRTRIPSFSSLLSRVMGTRPGRVGVVTAWAWIGLHYFAR